MVHREKKTYLSVKAGARACHLPQQQHCAAINNVSMKKKRRAGLYKINICNNKNVRHPSQHVARLQGLKEMSGRGAVCSRESVATGQL